MQHRFIKYRDQITSEDLNKRLSGIIAAGVYRGFDTIIDPVGLTFKIGHSTTGELYTNIDLSISPRLAAWVTKQGVVIKEDAPLNLTIETNLGNSSERTDLLVGKHYHDKLYPGGVAATYQIVKGSNGTTNPPDISADPNLGQMVILGKFTIKANGTSMAAVTWKRNRAASLGGKIPALLNEANSFTDIVSFAQAPAVTVTLRDFEIAARGIIDTLEGGNTYVVQPGNSTLDLLPNKPNGTRIALLFKANTLINGMVSNLIGGVAGVGTVAGYVDNYRPISIKNAENVTYTALKGQILVLEKINLGGAFDSATQTYEYGEVWKLVSSSDSLERIAILETAVTAINTAIISINTQVVALTTLINNINPPRLIQDIDFLGDFNVHFDASGKAKATSPYYGRAICNGQNTTPDFRGRFRVSYSDVEYEYSSVGFIGGDKFVTLATSQLPAHSHYMNVKVMNKGSVEQETGQANRMVVGVGGVNGRTSGDIGHTDANGQTGNTGDGAPHENRPPYRVALSLMWIGITP